MRLLCAIAGLTAACTADLPPAEVTHCDPAIFAEFCAQRPDGSFVRDFCAHDAFVVASEVCPAACRIVDNGGGPQKVQCDEVPVASADATGDGGGATRAGPFTKGHCSCLPNELCTPCPVGQACLGGQCIVGWCGLETCAEGQWCEIGSTKPCEEIACELPAVVTPHAVYRVVLGKVADKTTGCDLNNDGKVDNQLAPALAAFLGQINGGLDQAFANGELVALFDVATPTAVSALTVGTILTGQPAPDMGACDLKDEKADCKVWVRKQAYALDKPGACVAKAKCSGLFGDPGISLACDGTVPQPVAGKPEVTFPGYQVTLTGKLSPQTRTGKLLMCGVLKLADINALLAALPESVVESAGIGGPKQVMGMIAGLAKPDIDTDGDGTPDAVSFAGVLELGPATVTGVTK